MIALEAVGEVPPSPNMVSSHGRSLETLRSNERHFNAIVEAYADASVTGRALDDDVYWEKLR